MWIGSALGATLYALKVLHRWRSDDFFWIPEFFYRTPFMMMAFYLFVSCTALQIALTLMFPKEPGTDPEKLHCEHPLDPVRAPGWPGLANYKALSILVLLSMVALYSVFN